MRLPAFSRRRFFSTVAGASVALPFFELLQPRRARAAAGVAERFIVFYFPNGVAGVSQDGEPSQWNCTGSGSNFSLSPQLQPLAGLKGECLFLNGLSMGPTDNGNHPGGARKLLTGADYGNGESIDQLLARTAGADAPFRHLNLGAMVMHDGPSGDAFISYSGPGAPVAPQDDPVAAFEYLFGAVVPGSGGGSSSPDPQQVTVIDAVLDDMDRLRTQLGALEQTKLDQHLEALREVEDRIKNVSKLPASCEEPSLDTTGVVPGSYDPSTFPAVLRAQIDLTVLAMACGLSRVGVIQCAHHTSDIVITQFPGTEMYDPGFNITSHGASHYGSSHTGQNYDAHFQQGRYWAEQFAYLLQSLADRPDPLGGGSMLDTSVVLLCTEVSDGNTHEHHDMPFVLAGRAGGAIQPGRLLDFTGQRHAGLLASIAHAMGEPLGGFGDMGTGPLSGIVG
ncbi:MAG: DUF1552 domain-containing protein [Myxococcales bacterium]|nr:DUF1552 domain-containing protein [Myxococcales bacterium]